ncbi:uncharacterized protein GGS22DRAFT_176087 [Annulohypoxylon maeteangense]|uniref:uncharacterized protein n=1 Tax=Annulohypoxylon maeteangense TaxID=1927788 RepID=UPI002008E3AF|nr:uncharacterized protein GGS22DRAFT_176087 [Annulohypoxylon maeteangense]KAI0880069.1 hypothetical protein GGS22DRAFT_176087 [Annulohypoxylon maeteangense]
MGALFHGLAQSCLHNHPVAKNGGGKILIIKARKRRRGGHGSMRLPCSRVFPFTKAAMAKKKSKILTVEHVILYVLLYLKEEVINGVAVGYPSLSGGKVPMVLI